MAPSCRRWIATALIALTGCSTWKVVEVSPMAVDGSREVRVTRPDGSRVVVTSPRITPDSLVGIAGGNRQGSVALPLSDVSRIAVRTPDREKNSALKLFAGVTAATFALWMALVVAGS